MKFLLDTHLLLWASHDSRRLPAKIRTLLKSAENELFFSVASIWEVAIKHSLGRANFAFDPRLLRRALIDHDYCELDINGKHALEIAHLPLLHRDPFDRILIAQATVEGITLLTSDPQIAQYSGPISCA
jgi:PIN domain nuclease of toxin-antitoxin system